MVPFNTVEKPAFKSMLQKFDKQYELPGKTYFSETAVLKMYSRVKTSIKSELMNVDYFSATADMWSSVNMTPYMSLTVHYLSMEWILKSRCLETVFMPENHTSDNIWMLSGTHLKSGPWMRISWPVSLQTTGPTSLQQSKS